MQLCNLKQHNNNLIISYPKRNNNNNTNNNNNNNNTNNNNNKNKNIYIYIYIYIYSLKIVITHMKLLVAIMYLQFIRPPFIDINTMQQY